MNLTSGMMKDMPSCKPLEHPVAEAVKEQTAVLKDQTSVLGARIDASGTLVATALGNLRAGLEGKASYKFDVKRDKDGLIESVIASPI